MDSGGSTTALSAVGLPADGAPSQDFVLQLQQRLAEATKHSGGAAALQQVLPANVLNKIIKKVAGIVDQEATLLEIQPGAKQQKVTVVGDTHGQFHDLCRLFALYGQPSSDRIYIFNGDFVDRGAWGVETLTLLLAWKWLLPNNVYLIRGNHETSFCTKVYGFWGELRAKYGNATTQLYKDFLKLFAHLPLAALVQGNTLILHGGLFRAPPVTAGRRARGGSDTDEVRTGTLDDLRHASKGGADPDPDRSLKQLIASDVLWSDPSPNPGHRPNDLRGVGTNFGPDVTETFMSQNKLKLIIRSHEGPDARVKRADNEKMGNIDSGYSEDHIGRSGRLVTLFSAPDYPQFMAEGEQRYNNQAAVLHLTAPDYATPAVDSFEADLPRPQAHPYYEVEDHSETDHELEPVPVMSSESDFDSITRDRAVEQQHDQEARGRLEQLDSSTVINHQQQKLPEAALATAGQGLRRSQRTRHAKT